MAKRRSKKEPPPTGFRKFFDERLTYPLGCALLAGVTALFLVTASTWAGYRGRGMPWGDPIRFVEALSLGSKIAALTFVVMFLVLAITRARIDGW